ncbi:MAG: GNAT family N-acetyltransferase [Pseudomonadota bacterium]
MVKVVGAQGRRLALRLIQVADAPYVYDLRTNPAYSEFLSKVQGGVEGQFRWIELYKLRELAGLEYYFIIERLDGVRCGVVRLYDINHDQFSWGSWILDCNKPQLAALESAVLSFGLGFEQLGRKCALIQVRNANEHAKSFYRRFGLKETHSDGANLYFSYTWEQFLIDRVRHYSVLAGEVLP